MIVRPEDVHLAGNSASDDESLLSGEIVEVMFVGETLECQVMIGDTRIRLKLHPTTRVAVGEKIDLAIPVERCLVLPE